MRFIVLGDLHYSVYSRPEIAAARDRAFEQIFRQVATHKADYVFAIGDTTNWGAIEELDGQDAAARRAGLDLIRITGNHDMESNPKPVIASYFLGRRKSESATDLYTAFDAGNVRFVLLDTSRSQCSTTDWSGFVSDEQLTWLAEQVTDFNARSDLRYFVALGHHPLYNTTALSKQEKLYITNGEAVAEIFNRVERAPAFFFNGHNHCNSLIKSADGRWVYVQSGAPLITESYRVITVDETGFNIETPEFDFGDPQFLDDFTATRDNFDSDFTPYPKILFFGSPADLSYKG
jgi:3',5'-cyclic-AMP phosphodiesterase